MARTDWQMDDTVTPADINQIGQEINAALAQGVRPLAVNAFNFAAAGTDYPEGATRMETTGTSGGWPFEFGNGQVLTFNAGNNSITQILFEVAAAATAQKVGFRVYRQDYGAWSPVLNVPASLAADAISYDDAETMLGAANVQEAVEALNEAVQDVQNAVNVHINASEDAHDASAISLDSEEFEASDVAAALEEAKTEIDGLKEDLEEGQTIPAPISRGVNVIQSDQASGATFSVKGRTLCNILGRDGNCESLESFTASGSPSEISTTQVKSGISSIRFSRSDGAGANYLYKDYPYVLDAAKQYFLAGWAYIESYTGGTASLSLRDIGTTTSRYQASVNTALLGQWQFIYAKVPVANALVGNGFRLLFGQTGTSNSTVYFDDIRLFEVSAADSNAIGTTIVGEEIDRHFPYVDGVQPLRGVSVRVTGKNLSKGIPDVTNTSAILEAPYQLKIPVGNVGASVASNFVALVSPNTQYTLRLEKSPLGRTRVDGNLTGPILGLNSSANIRSFNSGNNTQVTVTFDKPSVETSEILFQDWMLVLGGADQLPANFEPYASSYANASISLYSNVDRTIADSYDSATGQVFGRYQSGFKFVGSLSPQSGATYSEHRRIAIPNASIGNVAPGNDYSCYMVKYDGSIIRAGNTEVIPEAFNVGSASLFLSIPNEKSGWVAGITPNENARAALLNGWRATGNNGTVYNSWVSMLDGSPSPTNTGVYVAANKAPGWDAYATLDYVRTTPITEQLTADLGGLDVVKGGNTVELLEGVVVREKVTPVYNGSVWSINRTTLPASQLKKRLAVFLAAYDGEMKNDTWQMASTEAYGNYRLYTSQANVPNPDNVYVDYIVLDKYAYTANAVDATFSYRPTLGGAVAQATQDIAKLKQHEGVQDWALDYIEAKTDNVRYDLDAQVNQDVRTTATPRFNGMSLSGRLDANEVNAGLVNSGGHVMANYDVYAGNSLHSFAPDGTAPIEVYSQTVVPNLNVDMVDGIHAADLAMGVPAFASTGGTGIAYTATFSPAFSKTAGRTVRIRAHTASGATPTLNANGTGASPIRKATGSPASLATGGIYTLTWDAVLSAFILQGEGGEGNAAASDLRQGRTATTDTGLITGTMPSRESQYLPGNIVSAASGYLAVSSSMLNPPSIADSLTAFELQNPNFNAANIRSGVNIFGLVGTLTPAQNRYYSLSFDGSSGPNPFGVYITPLVLDTIFFIDYIYVNIGAGTSGRAYFVGRKTASAGTAGFTSVTRGVIYGTTISSIGADASVAGGDFGAGTMMVDGV